jgi:hypothetical protein
MNERIKELAHECFVITDDGRFDYANEYMVQRFAELIVRECAEIVEETRWMVPPSQEQIARSIKQHFGVE